MSAVERAEHNRAVNAVRAWLGEDMFAAAWEKGHRMTVDEALQVVIQQII
jgi:hypothetical protein